MQNRIVLFDIDYTIFDTSRYKQNTAEYICRKFHIRETDMNEFDRNYRSKTVAPLGVNMKDFTEQMAVQFSLSSQNLYQLLIDAEEIFIDTLYTDVLSTLSHLSKHYTLGIFSQGHFPFQKNKLIKTKSIHFFDEKHIYIHPDKLHDESLNILPKNAIVIDDKVSVVEQLPKHIHAIHIDRNMKIKEGTFPIIHSLHELSEAINQIKQ